MCTWDSCQPSANELGLGVPKACQVRSAVVLLKKEKKKVRPKYLLVWWNRSVDSSVLIAILEELLLCSCRRLIQHWTAMTHLMNLSYQPRRSIVTSSQPQLHSCRFAVKKSSHQKGDDAHCIHSISTGAASTHVCQIINYIGKFHFRKQNIPWLFQKVLHFPSQKQFFEKKKFWKFQHFCVKSH